MKPAFLTTLALAATLLSAPAQTLNVQQLSRTALGADVREVAISGNYAFVAQATSGIKVLDVTNAAAPVIVGTIVPNGGLPNIDIRDVEIKNGILYASNSVPNGSPTPHTGVFMYDISNPLSPALAGTITWGAGGGYHFAGSVDNLCVDEAAGLTYVYCASEITSCVEVFDVTNPAVPVYKDTINPPRNSSGFLKGHAHDVTVRNGICASAWWDGGLALHNVSNIASSGYMASTTTLINWTPYANAQTMHLAFNTAGTHVITTDWQTYIGLRTWNLASIVSPTTPMVPQAQYTSGTGTRMHNIRVLGKYAYVSHFMDGLRIIDISNPASLLSVGWFDTRPTTGGTSVWGGWGVWPTSTNVYLTDSDNGLYVLDFVDTITPFQADWKNSTKTLTVQASSTAAPSTVLSIAGFGPLAYSTTTGKYTAVFTGVLTNPGSIAIQSDIGGQRIVTVRRR